MAAKIQLARVVTDDGANACSPVSVREHHESAVLYIEIKQDGDRIMMTFDHALEVHAALGQALNGVKVQ